MSNLIERDKKNVWHPFTPLRGRKDPIAVASAQGAKIITADGTEIIDSISSWWVNIHGHSNAKIAKAISDQASQLEHVIFADFTHEPAVKLAENILSILPENQVRAFYSDNGSTSVEVAIKMAMQYWYNQGKQCTRLIALEGAYHGDTFGAMSVAERGPFSAPYDNFLFDVDFLPLLESQNDEEVIKRFEQLINQEGVGAFIFEPLVQGAAGMRIYEPALLDKLIAMARERDILCIADEVMTGFGRTGELFASNYLQNKPDIFCLSKGLTGGTMALGMTTCTQEIVEPFDNDDLMKTFFHGHSFTANPLACACSNASFEILMSDECKENIGRVSRLQKSYFNKVKGHPKLSKVRHLGTILAMEISTDGKTSYFNDIRNDLYYFFMDKGVLLRPLGNVIYVLPPYVITDEELSKVYGAIDEMLERF